MSDNEGREEETKDFFRVTSLIGTSCTFPLSPIRHLRARIGCYMDTCSNHITLLDEKGDTVQDEDYTLVHDVEVVLSKYTTRPVHLQFIIQETGDFDDVNDAAYRVVDHLEVKDYRILEWVESNSAHPIKKIKEEAWFTASCSGNTAVLEYLLSHIEHIEIVDDGGSNALVLASHNGREENVKWLTQSTADINTPELWGRPGDTGPICGCHPGVVSLLLNAKAPTDSVNWNGETPFDIALSWESRRNLSIVDSLINAQVDVNAHGMNGYTPLSVLARYYEPSDLPILERLLQGQADVNYPKDSTPILVSIMMRQRDEGRNDYEVIDLLLKAKANIHQQDSFYYGPSAVSLAAEWEDDELKNYLLRGSSEYEKLR